MHFNDSTISFNGRIKEIFIPGWRDQNGITHNHIEASFIGFKIEILASNDSRRLDDTNYPKEVIVIEQGTDDTAMFFRGDMVSVPFEVIKGYDDWDGYNSVFLNLCNTPCIRKFHRAPQE